MIVELTATALLSCLLLWLFLPKMLAVKWMMMFNIVCVGLAVVVMSQLIYSQAEHPRAPATADAYAALIDEVLLNASLNLSAERAVCRYGLPSCQVRGMVLSISMLTFDVIRPIVTLSAWVGATTGPVLPLWFIEFEGWLVPKLMILTALAYIYWLLYPHLPISIQSRLPRLTRKGILRVLFPKRGGKMA